MEPMTTALCTAGKWLWKNYGKQCTDLLATATKKEWEKLDWEELETHYREKMAKLYGTMKLYAMSKPVPLEGIFTDVFLLDKPTAFSRYDISLLQKDTSPLPEKQAKRLAGIDLVKQKNSKRLFILGKPGAGKTTFLKYITIQAVHGQIPATPIFVSLKEWADSKKELMDFIQEQFETCQFRKPKDFIEYLLLNGHALVLFDALDEVNQANDLRSKMINTIKSFCKKYDKTQCLITCRIAANEYSFDDFTYVELADFTPEQSQTFARKWFQDNPQKREAFFTEFKKEEHKGLRDLASNPLLLTLLCIVFDENMEFPRRRVEIYSSAFDALLRKWDTSRNIKRDTIYDPLSPDRKCQLFAKVAATTFDKDEQLFSQDALEQHIVSYLRRLPDVRPSDPIDGEALLKSIEHQHGIFTERAARMYAFSHLTFQEYFTAKYIVDHASQGSISGLMRHIHEARWREVFLLSSSLLPDADLFFRDFKQQLDATIANEPKVRQLLQWAEKKAAQTQSSVSNRIFYIFVALNLALDLDLARDLDLDLARDLDLDRNSDLFLDYSLLRLLVYILKVAQGNFEKNRHNRLSDLSVSTRKQREILLDILQQRDDCTELYQALVTFRLPSKDDEQKEWKHCGKTLQTLLQQHRDIGHDWSLTPGQSETLKKYLAANTLLIHCLDVAVVQDREAIKNSLLRPPQNTTSTV